MADDNGQNASPGPGDDIEVVRLGCVPYSDAVAMQEASAAALRCDADAPERIFVLQHFPVITLGRHGDRSNVRVERAMLARLGLDVIATDRGGDVTVHSPGQVVVYLVLHLGRRRLGPARLVELLEEAMIDTCRSFGVTAKRFLPHPGVWVERGRITGLPSKIGAIGLRIAGHVTTHGIALNVSNDLSLFDTIAPCGLTDFGVTSLRVETGRDVNEVAVEDALVWAVRTELGDAPRPAQYRRPPASSGRMHAER